MNICLDGIGISRLHGTGLYAYTYELIDKLLDIYPTPYYDIVWDDSNFISKWHKNKRMLYSNLNINRRANDYSILEEHLKKNKINLYHCCNNGFSIPDKKICKYISTIHELLPLENKSLVDNKYYTKFMKRIPVAVENSDKIIAVSNFIKDELINKLQVPENKIEVIYPGCSDIFEVKSKDTVKNVLKTKYKIDDGFILCVGSIHSRKNLERVIKIFKDVKMSNPFLKLVIVGKNNEKRLEYFLKLKKLTRDLNIEDSVYFLGTVYYGDMPYFYNGSECVINLSEYEGFPLSSLEASKCKATVICSNSSAFPEFMEGNGILVNADDEQSIKEHLMGIIYSNNYKETRSKQERVNLNKKYKWENSAKDVIRLYENLMY